jgi:Mg-chelatase subunit ChlD
MKRINGIQFRQGVEKAAFKIAADLGMKVTLEWSNRITTAAISDRGHILLSSVADDAVVSQALLDKYIGFVIHELLHRQYTDFSIRTNDQYLDQLHNAVEDAWIERNGINANLTGNIAPLLTTLIDGMVTEANDTVQDWSNPAQYPFVLAVYLRDHAATKCPLANGLEPVFKEAFKRLDNCKNSGDTLKLAQWVHDQLKSLPKDAPKKPQRGSNQADQGKGEGEGAGQGKDAGNEAGNKAGQGQGQDAGQATAPTKTTEAMEVEPTLGTGEGCSGTYSVNDVEVADNHLGYADIFNIDINVPARLRFEVKKLFENSGTDEFQTNRRAGSINVKALSNINTSDRLFKRRLETEGVDSAVVIMLDLSGSMFDVRTVTGADGNPKVVTRIEQALDATAALLDTLNRAQVKTAVVSFGSNVAVLKEFSKPVPATIKLLAKVVNAGSTNDYQALRYSHEILYARPESRKVVFVLTDGFGHVEATRKQAVSGANIGITTVGIGIGSDVSRIYAQSVQVNNGGNLGDASFKQIKLAA